MIFENSGDYDQGLIYYQKALNLYSETNKISRKTGDGYDHVGWMQRETGDFKASLSSLFKSLEIRKKLFTVGHAHISDSYNSIGITFAKMGSLDKAIEYQKYALEDALLAYGTSNHPHVGYIHMHLGIAYFLKNNLHKAEKNLTEALHIVNNSEEPYPALLTEILYYLGKINIKFNKIDRAANNIQKSLIVNSKNFSSQDIITNPSAFDHFNNKKILPEILFSKAQILLNLYQKDKKAIHLNTCFETIDLSLYVLDGLRTQFSGLEAKKEIQLTSFKIIQFAIELYLNEKPNDTDKIFQFFEKNKALILLETITESEALSKSNIPDSILVKKMELEREIKNLNHQIFLSKKNNQQDKTKMLQNDQFAIFTNKKNLIKQIQQNYPQYYSLFHSKNKATINTVQKYLAHDKSTIIEYIISNSHIFIMVINENDIVFLQKNKPENFTRLALELRELISSNKSILSRNESQITLDFNKFISTSNQLFKICFAPVVTQITNSKKIIIIPDGVLNYIPFDILLQDTIQKYNYRSLNYLIKDYEIKNEFSCAFLIKSNSNKNNIKSLPFLGFAPEYSSHPLHYNEKEVLEISELWGGKPVLGKEATEMNFKKLATKTNILHLATHAFANTQNPAYSQFQFAVEDIEDSEILYAYEIENMRLNCELAVLSACETGAGKLQNGEGLIGLTRSFKNAGVANIVMSLWKAEDKSAYKIIIDFYKNIKAQMTCSSALRKAKIKFLASCPQIKAHPFYWSNISLNGDGRKISTHKSFPTSKLLLCFGIIGLVGYLIKLQH